MPTPRPVIIPYDKINMGNPFEKPANIIPIPKINPPTNTTFLGPNLSFIIPPVIIVIGPTEFVTVNTIAKLAAVKVVPARLFKYSAIGDANTLHAYIEPIHKLMKQLAINTIHLFCVKFITLLLDKFIK